MSDNFRYFKSISRLGIYFGLALGLFFLFAISIFYLRTRDSEKMIMPDLVGKYYTDVHNDLSQAQLRITILKKSYPERLPGVILYQSAPAGSAISAREKVYVVANQPEPLLAMPELVGNSLAAARAALSHITYNEEVYSLEIGMVSNLPTKEVSAGTVLAQFPPGNEVVTGRQKVYLLVSANPDQPPEDPAKLKGQTVSMLQQFFNRTGQEYRLNKVERPQHPEDNGLVFNVARNPAGVYLLDVYYREADVRWQNGYEEIEFDMEKGDCRADQLLHGDSDAAQTFFLSRTHGEDEETRMIFYRLGDTKVKVRCGDSVIYSKSFAPDDLG